MVDISWLQVKTPTWLMIVDIYIIYSGVDSRYIQLVIMVDHQPSWKSTIIHHHENQPSSRIMVNKWLKRLINDGW